MPDAITIPGAVAAWSLLHKEHGHMPWQELFNPAINYAQHGIKVHESVKKNHDRVSGITIHYVNENYDEGEIIFQKKIKINKTDTVKIISKKIKIIEHKYYPKVIERLLN